MPERYETLRNVLSQRSRYLAVVLEDIYQAQNASAVLRSADCFGFQDVHIIENNHDYRINPDVEKGASSWLNLHRHNDKENNSLEAIRKLKADGYRIIATTPHTDDINLEDFDVSKGKAAIIFGTEVTGISDIVKAEADEFMKIPMYGFSESFNISVSAAIVMQHLRYKIMRSDVQWQLSEDEANKLMLEWLGKSIRSSKEIAKRFKEEYAMQDK